MHFSILFPFSMLSPLFIDLSFGYLGCFYLLAILFFNLFIYYNWRLITLQYCGGFAIHEYDPPRLYTCSQSWTPLPPPSAYHPSGSSQCTSPKHPVSYIELGLVNRFHIWYYTCFNAILPNHPTLSLSHRVQKTVLYISVSFAVSYTGLLLPSF